MKIMDEYKTDEELLAEALEDLTPLEHAIHGAVISSYRLSHYGLLQEIALQIKEVELLRGETDLEERALLPLAEAGLTQLILTLPTNGDT